MDLLYYLLIVYLVSVVFSILFVIKFFSTLKDMVGVWLSVSIKNKKVKASKITLILLIFYMIFFPILNTYLTITYLNVKRIELLN